MWLCDCSCPVALFACDPVVEFLLLSLFFAGFADACRSVWGDGFVAFDAVLVPVFTAVVSVYSCAWNPVTVVFGSHCHDRMCLFGCYKEKRYGNNVKTL